MVIKKMKLKMNNYVYSFLFFFSLKSDCFIDSFLWLFLVSVE